MRHNLNLLMQAIVQEGTHSIYRDTFYTNGALMLALESKYRCAVEATVHVAGGKWKPIIIHYLLSGTKRFGELRRLIGGITQRSLTLQLRELEESGIITREIFAEVPPRVEYTLTAFGGTLTPILSAMKEWGESYIQHKGDVR